MCASLGAGRACQEVRTGAAPVTNPSAAIQLAATVKGAVTWLVAGLLGGLGVMVVCCDVVSIAMPTPSAGAAVPAQALTALPPPPSHALARFCSKPSNAPPQPPSPRNWLASSTVYPQPSPPLTPTLAWWRQRRLAPASQLVALRRVASQLHQQGWQIRPLTSHQLHPQHTTHPAPAHLPRIRSKHLRHCRSRAAWLHSAPLLAPPPLAVMQQHLRQQEGMWWPCWRLA